MVEFLRPKQEGNIIIDQFGRPVHLTGGWANSKGLHYDTYGITSPELLDELQSMGVHVIRLRLELGRFWTAPTSYDENYFTQPFGIDWLLNECDRRGIHVIINFQQDSTSDYFTSLSGEGFPAWMCQGYPNTEAGAFSWWIDFWRRTGTQQQSQDLFVDIWKWTVNRLKNHPCIIAYDAPVNEPIYWDPMNASEIIGIYYPYMERLIDEIRTIDPDRLIIVETLNMSTFDPRWDVGIQRNINRSNIAYQVHAYVCGSKVYGKTYDPAAPYQDIYTNPAVWNKQMLDDYVKLIHDTFMVQFNKPVVIGEAGTYHTDPNCKQWYIDLYEALEKYGIMVSVGFYLDRGGHSGLWYDDGTLKPWAEVLTQISTKDGTSTPTPNHTGPFMMVGLALLGGLTLVTFGRKKGKSS